MRLIKLHRAILLLILGIPLLSIGQPTDLKLQVIQSEFTFTKDSIKMANILRKEDGSFTGLRIQLKPGAAQELKKITRVNMGKNINLVINNKILHTTLLSTELEGDLLFTGISLDVAQSIINYLNRQQKTQVNPVFSSIND